MMYQMPQIPVPFQSYTHMSVHMPYMSMPPPYMVPGNIYHPTKLPFNQVSLVPHAVPPQAGHPFAGYRLFVNPNAGHHPLAHPRAPDAKSNKPVAKRNAQSAPNTSPRTDSERRRSVPTAPEMGFNVSSFPKNPIRKDEKVLTANEAGKLRTGSDSPHTAAHTDNQSPHRMSVLSSTCEATQIRERGGKESELAGSGGN